jgi:multiple RNA-binding domain-containing protein 1
VTDTKLVPKRRFAFVGYASEDDAAAAKKWFDGSFAFGGGKVKVDFVRDEPLAPKPEKPAKRARLDEPQEKEEKKEKREKKGLKEFMDVMKSVDPTKPLEAPAPQAEEAESEESEPEAVDDDDDDAAWLAKRQRLQGGEEEGPSEPRLDPEDALIMSTGRLFVRNLAFVTTAEDLREEFGKFGPVVDVHLPVSQKTGEPLGTAFVLFREPADALTARQKLDKMTFKGRLLHVLPGRARPGQEAVVETGKGTTDGKVLGKAAEARGDVKRAQDDKRAQATAKGLNWATLYMNVSDTRVHADSRATPSRPPWPTAWA